MDAGGDARNNNRRDGDGSDAERQFVKAVCVIEPRHRGRRGRRDGGCRDQLELGDAGGDQARQCPLEKHADLIARVCAIAPPARAGPQPGSRRYEELRDAGRGHGKGKPGSEIEMRRSLQRSSKTSASTITRLNRTALHATMPTRPSALNAAANTATSPARTTYGATLKSRDTASNCRAGSKPGATAAITECPKNMASNPVMPAMQNNVPRTRHVKRSAFDAPSLLRRNLSQIGTKALLSAPSDKRRRKKFDHLQRREESFRSMDRLPIVRRSRHRGDRREVATSTCRCRRW